MVYIRFHLPVLLPSYSTFTGYINNNLIRLCSICLIFFSQPILSSSKSYDRALAIAKSIDEYSCKNYVLTCFFRQRHHPSFDNEQESDNCKYILILHLCLHHDPDTIRICEQSKSKSKSKSTLDRANSELNDEDLRHCFTSSVYKNFYAQHLRSISPARTTVKCQIFTLLFLLISFVIKIRVCC
ncbi:unnamed protein product [Rotaria socialis]|nr:unnamed protein product [Rotaria socialis]CAF3641391.1 unnamed protein product [Rotaria socialis]CAF3647623.1 unnamed protein product [Rotaria socialis]CAF4289692.1 unnamed protein product [Rotaria socialis]CAF4411441.1 unnamed protein product [Rotaria socialis]